VRTLKAVLIKPALDDTKLVNGLLSYERARALIAELAVAVRIEDVKRVADQAAALKQYARQAHDPQFECWVAEIRLHARRRIGQLSAALEKSSGSNLPNVAALRHSGKRAALAQAGISKDEAHRCEQIARVEEVVFQTYIATKREAQIPVTADEVVKAVAKQARKNDVVQRTTFVRTLSTTDLSTLTTQGLRFGTVYADPPWQYANQGSRGATSDHYSTMTVEQITRLPVAGLATANAHLHLWTTNAFLFEAKAIMQAWGFDYRSCFVWVKPQIGMGNYWRVAHEFLLLGVRGECDFADHSLRSWGQFERGRHSAKPDEIRAFIERVSPGPRLELFGRKPIKDWVVWGEEIDAQDFKSAVERARS